MHGYLQRSEVVGFSITHLTFFFSRKVILDRLQSMFDGGDGFSIQARLQVGNASRKTVGTSNWDIGLISCAPNWPQPNNSMKQPVLETWTMFCVNFRETWIDFSIRCDETQKTKDRDDMQKQ